MDEQISWRVELRVKPGQLDRFRALTGAMVDATRAEPGVLTYQRWTSDDGDVVHVLERYENSSAAVAHLRMFAARFAGQFSSVVERVRFTVYGSPSAELRELLDGFGATYMKPFGDFAYWE